MTPDELADKIVAAIKAPVLEYSASMGGLDPVATSYVANELIDKACSLLLLGCKPGRQESLRKLVYDAVDESFAEWAAKLATADSPPK